MKKLLPLALLIALVACGGEPDGEGACAFGAYTVTDDTGRYVFFRAEGWPGGGRAYYEGDQCEAEGFALSLCTAQAQCCDTELNDVLECASTTIRAR